MKMGHRCVGERVEERRKGRLSINISYSSVQCTFHDLCVSLYLFSSAERALSSSRVAGAGTFCMTSAAGWYGPFAENAAHSGLEFRPPPSWGGSWRRSAGSFVFCSIVSAPVEERWGSRGTRSGIRLTAGCGWIENDCSWSPEPPMISLFWLFPGIVGGWVREGS
jgi:hypothetical protein